MNAQLWHSFGRCSMLSFLNDPSGHFICAAAANCYAAQLIKKGKRGQLRKLLYLIPLLGGKYGGLEKKQCRYQRPGI